MNKYTHNLNWAFLGEINKGNQGVPFRPARRARLMKMARYLSRSIHGA